MKYFYNKSSLLFFLIFLAVIDHHILSLPTKSKKKLTKNAITHCVTQYTKWNISGWKDNELKYFDRHPVKCPKSYLLKFFKMQIDKKLNIEKSESTNVTRMRFKYTCCKVKVYSCEWSKTKFVKSANAYKLAKIKPKCKCNKVLKEFRFVTKFQQPGYHIVLSFQALDWHCKIKTLKLILLQGLTTHVLIQNLKPER